MNASWSKYLPSKIRNKLDGRHGLQAMLGNSSWLFADKILRMGVGLLVGIWIVRYLGPLQLGLLSYAGAFAGLFGAVATLGLDNIVVRELVKNPSRQNELMGSAFVLKLVGGAGSLALAVMAISLVRTGETLTLWLVALTAAGFIFQSVNVIDFYFQSKVQSKFTVYSTMSAFLLLTFTKIVFLLVSAPLIAFGWAAFAEVVLTSFFLIFAYKKNHHNIREWHFEWVVARELLSHSWPLILSSFAIMIYMRIDQIMIGQMLGDREVGLFAAAVRISEMWYFVPMAIASSVFPTIVASKKMGDKIYYDRLQKYFIVMFWFALSVAIFVTSFKNLIIDVLYGKEYADSANVLAIHIWAGVFMAIGVAGSGWYMVENLQKYSFYRTLIGGVANVFLNFLLIPKYGIEGTAVSTVIAQALASLFFDASNKKTRPIFWIKIKSLNPLFLFYKNPP